MKKSQIEISLEIIEQVSLGTDTKFSAAEYQHLLSVSSPTREIKFKKLQELITEMIENGSNSENFK